MVDIHKALFAFWSRFGVPAFVSGHVPQGTPLPYITFDVAREEALGSNFLTAYCWYKAENGRNVNLERAEMLDKIADEIPDGGTILPLNGGGYLALYRNSANFQSYYDDPEDETVVGGRTSCQVNFYAL